MFGTIIECNCVGCLKKNIIFDPLSDEQLAKLNKNKYTAKYKAGETIFKQGTLVSHVLSLTDGLVKVYIEGLNDRNLILKLAKAGELIGGPGIFTDKRFHYTVTALSDSIACFLELNAIIEMIHENKEFAISLLTHVNKAMAFHFNKFIVLTQKQMQGRIADALIYLSADIYQNTSFTMDISRQDLADLTAMSKESAIRILKEFKEDGIISLNNNYLEILKPDKLKIISSIG